MTTVVTVSTALAEAARRLANAGVTGGRREARLLLAHAMGVEISGLIADPSRAVDAATWERMSGLVARRERREPLSHLLGTREFWSLPFLVTPDVLDPRPDSETLVEAALEYFQDRDAPLDVLDLGTGSGCLLLAFLSEHPRARGLGVDASEPALAVARANAERLGLSQRARFLRGDWGSGVQDRFDLVLCNPPYVPTAEIDGLEPEVSRYEPRLALDGGADGLYLYRVLVPQFKRLLHASGAVFVEVGAGQADGVAAMMEGAGFDVEQRRDLAGVVRCLVGCTAHFTKP